MAVLKVGNNDIGKISIIQPYQDTTGKSTHYHDIDGETWTRPSGWLDMPTGDDTVGALIYVPSGVHDLTLSMLIRGTGTNNTNKPGYIPVDWGDNTSGIIYGTRIDSSTREGYYAYTHKMYDYDLLSASTEIEINGITARQALITLDGSISGIGTFDFVGLAGANFGSQSTYTDGERKYKYTDPSGTVRNAPSKSSFRSNYQSSTLLEVYASGARITGCRITDDGNSGRHKELEKAYLNISKLGSATIDMFLSAINLQEVYFPADSTAGNTNFQNMFNDCHSLKSIPYFDTSSATSLNATFAQCYSITSVPNFDTSNVTNWSNTFADCINLKFPEHLSFSAAKILYSTFHGNYQLTHIPSGFSAPVATGCSSTFQECLNLVALPNDFSFPAARNINSLFKRCHNLSSPVTIDSPNLTSCTGVFESCSKLKEVHIKNLGSARHFRGMATGCLELQKLTWDNASTYQPTGVDSMFRSCVKLRDIPELDFSEVVNANSAFTSCSSIINFPFTIDLSKVQYTRQMFYSCLNLQSVNFKNVGLNRTNNTFNTEFMFRYCEKLESVSGLFENDPSTPKFMRTMFEGCTSLQDVSNFVVSGNTSTSSNNSHLFRSCNQLRALPKEINTQRGCRSMFSNCTSIISTPAYDLSASLDNAGMFNDCNSLRSCPATGISANIGFSDCFLSSGAIYEIFNNLETVSSATIDIRENHGVAELHPDTIAIATAKGWTVTT